MDKAPARRRKTTNVEAGKVSIITTRVRSRRIVSETEKVEEFDSEVFQTEPAFVRISHGVTKSIGDYESLRVDVAVTLPCYKEKVDETAQDLGEYVASVLERELDQYGINLNG